MVKKFMDALSELSQGSDEDSESEGGDDVTDAPAPKRTREAIDVSVLERNGYRSGPSVLLMPAPREQAQPSWGWDSGAAHKDCEPEAQTAEEREATREAVTSGLEASVDFATKAAALKEERIHARRCERAELRAAAQGDASAKDKHSFNKKEKRKRDLGQASRGKNFVEEEKRAGRNLGIYSGFD